MMYLVQVRSVQLFKIEAASPGEAETRVLETLDSGQHFREVLVTDLVDGPDLPPDLPSVRPPSESRPSMSPPHGPACCCQSSPACRGLGAFIAQP